MKRVFSAIGRLLGNHIKVIVIAVGIGLVMYAIGMYVYIGTYVIPIAPYWVTQLPPNPPKPKIKHGEFDFKLEYEVSGEKKVIEDTLVCDFAGFVVHGIGEKKVIEWKSYFKNEQKNELFSERLEPTEIYNEDNKTEFNYIVLFNSGTYKAIMCLEGAGHFLDKDKYYNHERSTMPYIAVYNSEYSATIGDTLESEAKEAFLDKHGFKVISWQCDPPIENTFR